MNDDTNTKSTKFRDYTRKLLPVVLLLGGGAAAGAVAMTAAQPQVTMAPATPTAIRTLSDGIVTVRGRAVELFGNKLVVQDATGRALVDLGREGEGGTLVRVGDTVTAQGRYERGFVHASFLVGADGKVKALGPLGGPPKGPHGGPDGRCGPPPPAPAQGAPAAPAPAPAQPPAS